MRYETPFRVFGLPLIHIATGADPAGPRARGVARGWIAIGDLAFGPLLAVGGLAVGGLALGGLALGVVPLGGAAFGVWVFGGLAVGVWALGGGAFALEAALGGLAVAGRYAEGGEAIAEHANDAVAAAYFDSSLFFRIAEAVADTAVFWPFLLLLLPLVQWLQRRSAA